MLAILRVESDQRFLVDLPIAGLEAIRAFWDSSRPGPDEDFRVSSEIVAVDGPVAVVRHVPARRR